MKQTFEIEVDGVRITEVLLSSLLREVFKSDYTIYVKEITENKIEELEGGN